MLSKPTGKRPVVRPRRRWEDNIRMDLKGIGLRIGIIGPPCECGTDPLGFISTGIILFSNQLDNNLNNLGFLL